MLNIYTRILDQFHWGKLGLMGDNSVRNQIGVTMTMEMGWD